MKAMPQARILLFLIVVMLMLSISHILPVRSIAGMAISGNLDFYIEADVEASEVKTFRVINTGTADLNVAIAICELNYTGTLSSDSVRFIISPTQFVLEGGKERTVEIEAFLSNNGEQGRCVGVVHVRGSRVRPEQGEGIGTMDLTLKLNLTLLGNPAKDNYNGMFTLTMFLLFLALITFLALSIIMMYIKRGKQN